MVLVEDYLALPAPDNSLARQGDAPLFDKRLGKTFLNDREAMGRLLHFAIVHASEAPMTDLEWVASNVGTMFKVFRSCDDSNLTNSVYQGFPPGT